MTPLVVFRVVQREKRRVFFYYFLWHFFDYRIGFRPVGILSPAIRELPHGSQGRQLLIVFLIVISHYYRIIEESEPPDSITPICKSSGVRSLRQSLLLWKSQTIRQTCLIWCLCSPLDFTKGEQYNRLKTRFKRFGANQKHRLIVKTREMEYKMFFE